MRLHTGNRNGQTTLLFTLALIPLFGMLGLVVDVGWAYFRKQAAQTAADAAASAAAIAAYEATSGGGSGCSAAHVACYPTTPYTCPANPATPPADNVQAGCLYAKANGFSTAGLQTVTIQSGVGAAPTSSGVTISYWVIARVSERIPQLFSAVLGFKETTVSARATTGTRQASAGGCVITLNPSAANALSVSGSAKLTSGCGVFVNSNSGSALNTNGGGLVTTTGTAKTQIVGNCPTNGCNISPAPQTGVPMWTDPFSSMSPPPEGSCQAGITLKNNDSLTISPGTYCGSGWQLGSSSHLILNPGVYVIDVHNMNNPFAIGLNAQSQLSSTGTGGVLIYMKNSAGPTSGAAINVGAQATVNLNAQSSGPYQGILFFQDRSDSTADIMEGGANQTLNGVLYFPKANLTYTGGSSSVATQTTIVSDTLTMVGNSYFSAAATTQFTGVSGGAFLIE